jgi:SAM-dependent methyltransferase
MTCSLRLSPPDWLRDLNDGPKEVRWNLQGMAAAWKSHPNSMDFLSPSSPNFLWKALQTDIYFDALAEELSTSGDESLNILDAACGIGRMSVPLATAGHFVQGLDASRQSLEAAARHIERAALEVPEVLDRVQLSWDDIATADLPTSSFDRVLALELLCYLNNPQVTAKRLAASLRPGGLLIASVEAWPGALLSWPERPTGAPLARLIFDRNYAVPGDLWVHPMEADELVAILSSVGLELLRLEPLHFFADGPLSDQVEIDKLGETTYGERLIELERGLRASPELHGLSRAWLAVARKKGTATSCA